MLIILSGEFWHAGQHRVVRSVDWPSASTPRQHKLERTNFSCRRLLCAPKHQLHGVCRHVGRHACLSARLVASCVMYMQYLSETENGRSLQRHGLPTDPWNQDFAWIIRVGEEPSPWVSWPTRIVLAQLSMVYI